MATTGPACPHCKNTGCQIEHSYTYGGVTRDFSYCGHCGKNWPAQLRLVPPPPVDDSPEPL